MRTYAICKRHRQIMPFEKITCFSKSHNAQTAQPENYLSYYAICKSHKESMPFENAHSQFSNRILTQTAYK